MTLLLPLGLLGLLGILALIIIYIIKPNYQTQHISSSYVWRLSLKYRKKRIPTSRLRNILLFLCQLFILFLMAAILSMPAIVIQNETDRTDVIAILDSSASMYAGFDGDIRFERAVDGIMELSDKVLSEGGYVSVILADDSPEYLARRAPLAMRAELFETLESLCDGTSCFYGTADIDAALTLSEEVLEENHSATVYLYTDTQYEYVPKGIEVVPVGTTDEWNAAILDAKAEIDDVYYELTVDVACYGRDRALELNVEITGANASDAGSAGSVITISRPVYCDSDLTKTLIFRYGGGTDTEDVLYYDLSENERFFSYQNIHISIDEADAFRADNVFDIYGGQKEVLKVQYASSNPNIFFSGALLTLHNAYIANWDIQITEVKRGEEPALEGFDLYIFEHKMPSVMPSDGIVFLMDPDRAPAGSGIEVGTPTDLMGESVSLTPGDDHPILKNIFADDITVSKYTPIALEDPFDVLMTCDGNPVLVSAKSERRQVVVMAFSVHFSNIAVMPEFILLFTNLFEYYLPATVNSNSFEVGESITVNGRGASMEFSGSDGPVTQFPATLTVDIPGTYTFNQTTYYDKTLLPVNIFVKIPKSESNICRVEAALDAPLRNTEGNFRYEDLLIYLAAGLVALLFAEWWLQIKENK